MSKKMVRRSFLLGSTSMLALALSPRTFAARNNGGAAALPADAGGEEFNADSVIDLARQLAAQPPAETRLDMPAQLSDLNYDQYRSIRYKPEAQVWLDEDRSFTLDLLHPGFVFADTVRIHVVAEGNAQELPFDTNLFNYDVPDVTPFDAAGLTFSGFRVRNTINRPDVLDEFLVFQGASYFRAVARNQNYGLSSRGLAIRTGEHEGEEFPVFTDFWIVTPAKNATSLTIHALLQSESTTGAFTFVVHPGEATVMEVSCALFPREDVASFGIGPLTSMFQFAPVDRLQVDDYRNRVHDSSGLQMVTGSGERIWRSLQNPRHLQLSSFSDQNPQGFGLVQRKRNFDDYQDAEAHYERRPSVWIEPLGNWGEGTVRLVEIPTENEFNDNIVVYWQPAEQLKAGTERRYAYRIHWCDTPPDELDLARIWEVRTGLDPNSGLRTFVIDFRGLETATDIEPDVSASTGTIQSIVIQPLPSTGLTRLSFKFIPDESEASDFRSVLFDREGKAVSETWLYRWTEG